MLLDVEGTTAWDKCKLAKRSAARRVSRFIENRVVEIPVTSTNAEKRGELTTASAQSVRLVVAFTKGRGTLRCCEVSWGLILKLGWALRTHSC